jgi:hypothetical protein
MMSFLLAVQRFLISPDLGSHQAGDKPPEPRNFSETRTEVKQFVAAALHPAFDDRVHPGHLNTTEHDLDAGVGEDDVEQVRVSAVAVADQEPCSIAGVLEVHDEVARCLGHPCQAAVGWGVAPRMRIARCACSITASTCMRRAHDLRMGRDGGRVVV